MNFKDKKWITIAFVIFIVGISYWRMQSKSKEPNTVNLSTTFDWINAEIKIKDRVLFTCFPDISTNCNSIHGKVRSTDNYFKPKSFEIIRSNRFILSERGPVALVKLFRQKRPFERLFTIVEKPREVDSKPFEDRISQISGIKLQKVENDIILVFEGGNEEIIKSWIALIDSYKNSQYKNDDMMFEHYLAASIFSDDIFSFIELYDFFTKSPKFNHLIKQNDVYAETVAFFFKDDRW